MGPRTALALASLAAASPVRASEPAVSVLVAPFEATSPASAGMAALLPWMLERELERVPGLQVVAPETLPPVGPSPASRYLENCPPGQAPECAWFVASQGDVAYAVTGVVEVSGEATAVVVSIVDVASAEEAVVLRLALDERTDTELAGQVAYGLGALVRGEVGQLQDPRPRDALAPDPAERARLAAEIEELAREIPEVEWSWEERGRALRPESFDEEDLRRLADSDATPPWEPLGMTPRGYARYRQSGLDLQSWRERLRGRGGQALVRVAVGAMGGPLSGSYDGAFVRDGETLEVVAVQATQAWLPGLGLDSSLSVGLGVHAGLELEAGIGRAGGTFDTEIRQIRAGEDVEDVVTSHDAAQVLVAHGGVRVGPLPARPVRPVAGLGLAAWRFSGVGEHVSLAPEELPALEGGWRPGLRATGGVEARFSDHLDGWVQVPVHWLLGNGVQVRGVGSSPQLKAATPEPSPFGWAVEAGLQLRFGVGTPPGP